MNTLYENLLITWCDRMARLQLRGTDLPSGDGGIFCPACCRIHGRCADSVYPFLAAARLTGERRYVDSACAVLEWSRNSAFGDGSWTNEPSTSDWRGITVFGQIALGEALLHHGNLLNDDVRDRWMARLRAASDFLYDAITFETGCINYPLSMPAAMALAAKLLGDARYGAKADSMAQEALSYFTKTDRLIYGEDPRRRPGDVTPKGARAVDVGYNVEESLPNLALYATLRQNEKVLQTVLGSARRHLELMLPDGAWDNSFGVRNYKWTYWGGRTSDGCQMLFALLAGRDPRFITAAARNTQLLAACTADGLLHGGPHYASHGERACVHHTFCHAKALAAAIDYGLAGLSGGAPLPQDEARGVVSFADLDTRLISAGPWRATVTGYDWMAPRGGHATGGALSLLWHKAAGPLLAGGMERYQRIEPDNQQLLRDTPDIPLIPRIELDVDGRAFRSCNDPGARLTADESKGAIHAEAQGCLVDSDGSSPAQGSCRFTQSLVVQADSVAIEVSYDGPAAPRARFALPLISPCSERAWHEAENQRYIVERENCRIAVSSPVEPSLAWNRANRIFQHVPGFEAIPLVYDMSPNAPLKITIRVI